MKEEPALAGRDAPGQGFAVKTAPWLLPAVRAVPAEQRPTATHGIEEGRAATIPERCVRNIGVDELLHFVDPTHPPGPGERMQPGR